jgi:hypothetical protein
VPTYEVDYDSGTTTPGPGNAVALPGGTVTQVSYSYTFPVPRFGSTAEQTWTVDSFTAGGTAGITIAPLDRPASFNATEVPDTTAPALSGLTYTMQPGAFDDGTTSTELDYRVHATDPQSGLWRARVVLTGPAGQTVSGTSATPPLTPGSTPPAAATVTVPVLLPQSLPQPVLGTWTVTEVDLTDQAGITHVGTGLSMAPVTYTDDSVITASDATLSQNPVDDWQAPSTSPCRSAARTRSRPSAWTPTPAASPVRRHCPTPGPAP